MQIDEICGTIFVENDNIWKTRAHWVPGPQGGSTMQDIHLIALDLDGTVFDDQKHITPRTLAAIRAALDKGIDVIPATGRSVTGVPKEFLHMPGVRYALTSNGASVVELATGKAIVTLPFETDLALRVLEVVQRFSSSLSLFVNGECYTDPASAAIVEACCPPELLSYVRDSRVVVDDLAALIRSRPGEVEKFSIMYASTELRDAAREAVLAACPEVDATSSVKDNLELNAPGVNKGRGLMALAEYLGLRKDQVMACGDSGNDLEMVRLAGLGVAMANAFPEVKEVADVITLDNNHDGVAAAIETYALGKPVA